MSIHTAGVIGLVLVFVIGTLRPVNLGALALVMTFLRGTIFVGEDVRLMYSGFPVDLLILLTGVTYLFAIAQNNGTVDQIVERATRLAGGRRSLIPWVVFLVASLPALAGALGSAGVALLAPIALQLAKRFDLDRRMIGLMVVHGAAAGNFSPLNPLGAIVNQIVARNGLALTPSTLFLANIAYNVGIALVLYLLFARKRSPDAIAIDPTAQPPLKALAIDQVCTLLALVAVAVAALGFDLSIGFLAFGAAVVLQLLFPKASTGADRKIAWGVVLLVCGIVTYVAALQRYGTVDAVGHGIAGLGSPLMTAMLLCAVGAVASAFASSAGILGAMIPLALPIIARGGIDATGLIVALAISVTVVDGMPFSTVGALVVANADEDERPRVYRGLLWWGTAMVVTAPVLTWLIFVLPRS